MKKILSLLLLSSSLFSMELQVIRPSKFNAQYKSTDISKVAFAKAITPHTPFASPVKIASAKSKSSPVVVKHKLEDLRIDSKFTFVPERLGSLQLNHGENGFSIIQDGKKYEIQKCFIDSGLRNTNKEQLQAFLKSGYISVNQADDGTFTLKAHSRILGGGAIGAAIGAFLGKATVSVIGHGIIVAVSALTGPAAPVTFVALESCFGAAIEATSMAGAVAGGIALGVATGPV